jgi:hypothetical protein
MALGPVPWSDTGKRPILDQVVSMGYPPSKTRDGACVAHGPVPSAGRWRIPPPYPLGYHKPMMAAALSPALALGCDPSPQASPVPSRPVKAGRTLPAGWGPQRRG